jgi:eukaryotic-like serine/threonine-protein kinase
VIAQAALSELAGAPHLIGRYRIDAPLGAGAMAEVYLAFDPSIQRKLAIKVLDPALRNNPEIVRRFLAEARAAGMLSHPHIVTIHDVGEADGVPYIAMELLEGKPLDEILQTTPQLPIDNAVELCAQIASALSFAHGQGVIHRDAKPSNIIVGSGSKSAKLLDFGIARIEDGPDSEAKLRSTQFGQVMGTPRYMSPEQAMGLTVDARTDLFSLGSILYEMVAGQPAFPGTGLATLAIQIAQEHPVQITSHRPDCPKGVIFIIAKLLAKRPADRFSDADAVRAALLRELADLRSDHAPVRRGLPVRVKLPLGLGAATALALLLGVTAMMDRQTATLEDMAKAAGGSTVDFVTQNVAIRVAENAGLAPEEQDWLPLQSFIEAAARDRNVRRLAVFDEHGVVRAAAGRPFGPVAKTEVHAGDRSTADGFSFVRPVVYAGAPFGRVEMEVGRGGLDTAISTVRMLLLALSTFVVAIVVGAGFFAARQLTQPLRRLGAALDDSSARRDEFGAVFDSLNRLAASLDESRPAVDAGVADQRALMTQLENAFGQGHDHG